ncbi:alpha/beta fold hydrolase [Nocardia sp. CA-120079]|uniref:alpha/beta fold hydrolase n=1 Tax=Nocardia sp. CA-120079 TaxID=3239974 RepID=UPI003D99D67D
MECDVNGVSVHYLEYGSGTPILIMHGSGVDHREMVATMEPIFGDLPDYRRIYLDLPGMGRTPAPGTINSSDDVVALVLGVIDIVVGDRDLLVIGHSAGGYFARAVANRRRGQVSGLTVICPLIENPRDIPAHQVVRTAGNLDDVLSPDDRTEFEAYFVVHTPAMRERFQHYVAPAVPLADQTAMARIGERWRLSSGPEDGPPYPNPTLIIAGRQDSAVGYAGQWDLIEHYPHATFAVLDRAGHALPHEQGDLVKALVIEWLRRVEEHRPA